MIDETYLLKMELDRNEREIEEVKSKDDRIEMLERKLLGIQAHLDNFACKSSN